MYSVVVLGVVRVAAGIGASFKIAFMSNVAFGYIQITHSCRLLSINSGLNLSPVIYSDSTI